ncbi:hypothetical protein ACH3XW_5315 [Acanthocheilonema viteae]|uniref:Uncharacterized protein n=1 Tax=Acanthocheilonema viteae TaxID=6277 RepID=A0A498S5U9_ACAVI|nr:unnamed protein product [Acanthocheilonema viteae]
MLKKKRAILKMSESELEAVVKVISPGRSLQKRSKSDLQEEVIRWVLENGLRVSHEFTVIEMDDGNYGVIVDKNGCTCCQKLMSSSANQHIREDIKKKSANNLPSEMAESIRMEERNHIQTKANPTPSRQHGPKEVIIGTQPLPTILSSNDITTRINEDCKTEPEEHSKQQKDVLSQCCAELGSCCISLLSNC